MRLHVILGLADNKPSSPISVVYAGRSGVEARQAMDNSPCPRFYVLQNPLGFSKNNRHAAANAAKAASVTGSTASHTTATTVQDGHDIDGILAANEQLQATVEKLEAELKVVHQGFEELVLEKKKLAEALNAAGSPEPTVGPADAPPPADQQNSDQQEAAAKPPSKETTPAKPGKNATAKPPTPGGKK